MKYIQLILLTIVIKCQANLRLNRHPVTRQGPDHDPMIENLKPWLPKYNIGGTKMHEDPDLKTLLVPDIYKPSPLRSFRPSQRVPGVFQPPTLHSRALLAQSAQLRQQAKAEQEIQQWEKVEQEMRLQQQDQVEEEIQRREQEQSVNLQPFQHQNKGKRHRARPRQQLQHLQKSRADQALKRREQVQAEQELLHHQNTRVEQEVERRQQIQTRATSHEIPLIPQDIDRSQLPPPSIIQQNMQRVLVERENQFRQQALANQQLQNRQIARSEREAHLIEADREALSKLSPDDRNFLVSRLSQVDREILLDKFENGQFGDILENRFGFSGGLSGAAAQIGAGAGGFIGGKLAGPIGAKLGAAAGAYLGAAAANRLSRKPNKNNNQSTPSPEVQYNAAASASATYNSNYGAIQVKK